ncbi:MAG: tyrosine-type recombinase/integrase [Pseudonocardiaceae bacterium]|nr:tyrosine-type recombinase/integrase [Pseudonocardiaceae bacterium]
MHRSGPLFGGACGFVASLVVRVSRIHSVTNASARRGRRRRGSIQQLPSGALRVSVYAGTDPVTKRRHYLREVIAPSPTAETNADKALRRLANQVDERRNPRTNATLNQLLDRHLEMLDLEPNTIEGYRELADNHIRPLIGTQKVGSLGGDVFDSFYAELRRCRRRCSGRPFLEHRTEAIHDCDDRCRVHACRPLASATVRKIHFILSGALKRAVRWRWIAMNPIDQAEPPPQPRPNPQPPSAEEAARILGEAWSDPDWGLLVWLTMVTGFRRGELCGLRWRHLDLVARVIALERSIGQRSGRTWEKGTKTHQHRRIALDPETVALLVTHRGRCTARAHAVGVKLAADSFVFSPAVDGSEHLKPDSVTQRYGRLAARLGIKTSIHKLRHYSATELIAAGVDVRTVAGRLGHGGGGSTTLKVYAAWVSESDQRAATSLFSRMPARPQPTATPVTAPLGEARSPYEKIAVELRGAIESGALAVGDPIPTVAKLAADHDVVVSTAQRAVTLLKAWGMVDAARGRRARVISAGSPSESVSGDLSASGDILTEADSERSVADDGEDAMTVSQLWAITVRAPDGHRYPPRRVTEDIDQPDSFRPHLLGIARMEAPQRTDSGEDWIGDFELEIREPGKEHQNPELTLRWQKP